MKRILCLLSIFYAVVVFSQRSLDADFEHMVLQKEISGGFVAEEYFGYKRVITIWSDGSVVYSYRKNFTSPMDDRLIALLPRTVLENIEDIVSPMDPGEMTVSDGLGCVDAPAHVYSAFNSYGVKIDFAQEINCQLHVLENFYDKDTLMKLLDGLEQLTIM